MNSDCFRTPTNRARFDYAAMRQRMQTARNAGGWPAGGANGGIATRITAGWKTCKWALPSALLRFHGTSRLGQMNTTTMSDFTGRVEFTAGFQPRPQISHVLFDFDGTLSLIREGWPEVMVPMFVEMLPARPNETEAARRQLCFEDIMRLNGKQTIYQMMQLAERIKERGGTPRDPLVQHEYLRRLDERIGIERCVASRDDQARRFAGAWRAGCWRNCSDAVCLFISPAARMSSLSNRRRVIGFDRYFEPHIYGALDNYKQFSKKW